MPVGADHEMARVIRVAIHYNEIMLAAIQDVVLDIGLFTGFLTQDAALWFLHVDILDAPGCPDSLHDLSSPEFVCPAILAG